MLEFVSKSRKLIAGKNEYDQLVKIIHMIGVPKNKYIVDNINKTFHGKIDFEMVNKHEYRDVLTSLPSKFAVILTMALQFIPSCRADAKFIKEVISKG